MSQPLCKILLKLSVPVVNGSIHTKGLKSQCTDSNGQITPHTKKTDTKLPVATMVAVNSLSHTQEMNKPAILQ